jgi:CHAT domain-containing protein
MSTVSASNQYQSLITHLLNCGNKEAIFRIFESNPDAVQYFDEQLLALLKEVGKDHPNGAVVQPLVQSMLVEKTVSFLTTLPPEEAISFIQEHRLLLLSREAAQFLLGTLEEMRPFPDVVDNIRQTLNLICSEITFVLAQSLALDAFVEVIRELELYLMQPAVPFMLERLKLHYPEQTAMLNERIRVVTLLQRQGLEAAVEDLQRLQYKALMAELQHPTQDYDLPYKKQMTEIALQLATQYDSGQVYILKSILGRLYMEWPEGDKADNLEKALSLFKEVLREIQLLTSDERTVLLNDLGTAYLYRLKGLKEKNLETAIEYFGRALESIGEGQEEYRAMVLMNLGICYGERLNGVRAENLEQSIALFKQSLGVLSSCSPADAAEAKANLAIVYVDRIKGEKASNVECAISLVEEALQVLTKDNFPEKWAICQLNLSLAYQHRLKDNRLSNLRTAISCIQNAQEVFTEKAHPWDWAMSCNNLALLYLAVTDEDEKDEQSLDQAIVCLSQSGRFTTFEHNSYEWAMVQFNRGLALSKRGVQRQSRDDLYSAVDAFTQTLKVRTREGQPYDWAICQYLLGKTLYVAGQGTYSKNYPNSVYCLKQAMEVLTPELAPRECLDCALLLGRIYHETRSYGHSLPVLQTAYQCTELLRIETSRAAIRKALSFDAASVNEMLVEACLEQKDIEKAFVYATAAKSRSLLDRLQQDVVAVEKKRADDPLFNRDWQPVIQLREEIDMLSTTLAAAANGKTIERKALLESLNAKRLHLKEKLADIFFRYPDLAARQAGTLFKAADIQLLTASLGDVCLLEYYRHAGGWGVFIVEERSITFHPLDDAEQAMDTILPWLIAYDKDEAAASESPTIKQQLHKLHEAFIAPVFHRIKAVNEVIIAPFGALHLLPFQASLGDDGLSLIEHVSVRFVPSLSILKTLHDQKVKDQSSVVQNRLLGLACSATHFGRPIPHVLKEIKTVASWFSQAVILKEEVATLQSLFTHASAERFSVFHFACHGDVDKDDADNSGLLLQNGYLTVERIQTELNLKGSPIVVLAACQTGYIRPEASDEQVGLHQAFLTAGGAGVVTSLWSVDDEATEIFFAHFYRQLNAGASSSVALQKAMLALRNEERFQEPIFWAPFLYTGL